MSLPPYYIRQNQIHDDWSYVTINDITPLIRRDKTTNSDVQATLKSANEGHKRTAVRLKKTQAGNNTSGNEVIITY